MYVCQKCEIVGFELVAEHAEYYILTITVGATTERSLAAKTGCCE